MVCMFQLTGLGTIKQATSAQSAQRAVPVWLPDVCAHLQCLNKKFGFDNSAASGLQIKKIRSAASLAPDALEHTVDFHEMLGVLTGAAPGGFRKFHEFTF